jgi:hypothetical protein
MSKLSDILAAERDERDRMREQFNLERQAWGRERKELLDRIQHPETRVVSSMPAVEYEAPKDAAELAQVGQEVPYGVQVGDTDWKSEVNHIASEE